MREKQRSKIKGGSTLVKLTTTGLYWSPCISLLKDFVLYLMQKRHLNLGNSYSKTFGNNVKLGLSKQTLLLCPAVLVKA